MPSSTRLTPPQREAVGAILAVILIAGPVWIPALHLDDPTYRYERARVTADGGTLAFANASGVPAGTMVSDEIACSGSPSRVCAFERQLTRNHTVLTEIYSTHPGERTNAFAVGHDRYDYVRIDGVVYETITLANRSRVYVVADGTVYRAGEAPDGISTSGDVYRNELSLRQVSPAAALADVSRDAESVSAPIRRAARTGVGVANRERSVPRTPIRTADGAYYRVYLDDRRQPVVENGWVETLLVIGAPTVGLLVLFRLRRRVEITYVGPSDDPTDDEPEP